MERVLVVFPTQWDERQLRGPRRAGAGRFTPVFAEPSDAECSDSFDVLGYIERSAERWRGQIDGVFSSSDYPGATSAAAIAQRLGLAGSDPDTVMRSSHKYYSRLAQREGAPEATPRFALVDPRRPDGGPPKLPFPFFIKPVKGAFSVLARRIEDAGELAAFLADPAARTYMRDTMRIFNQLVRRYGRFELDGGWFLAEELLAGRIATLEGFATEEGVELLGIVDSVVHPATGSFLRFDYPSALSEDVQARMADVARRIVGRLGLRHSLFNIEMIHDPATGAVRVLEVNPRMCGQFADLYEKVDGIHGHEVALELAVGRRPRLLRGKGRFKAASSWPLRVFEPVRVGRAPSAEEIAIVEAEYPGAFVWSECTSGQVLADFALEDGFSARYAVINAGGADREALDGVCESIRARLGYELVPLAPAR